MLARDNNVQTILDAVTVKVASSLNVEPANIEPEVMLALAKGLGLLRGQRGRNICGTYSTPAGLAFIGEKAEIPEVVQSLEVQEVQPEPEVKEEAPAKKSKKKS